MRTFAEIYDIALKAGIVDEYKRYNLLLADALNQGKDTNAINYNFDDESKINRMVEICKKHINDYYNWDISDNLMEISYKKIK